MSNGENSGTATPAEAQVPKQRLDEVIERARRAEAEAAALKQVLNARLPGQTQAPRDEDPPQLKKLKEENPEMYGLIKNQQHQIKQANALGFMNAEANDRLAFTIAFPNDVNRLQEVEQHLADMRQRGVNNWSRTDIFRSMLGDEELRKKYKPAAPGQATAPVAPVQTAAPAVPPIQAAGDAPPSNPGAAPSHQHPPSANGQKETLEQMEARLANVEL